MTAAIVGACAWAIITVTTKHQIGWMALGVGLLVGFSISFAKGGYGYRILGALFALLGCATVNFLSFVTLAAGQEHISVFTAVAHIDYAAVAAAMWESFLSTDIVFYLLAIYEGYRFSVPRSARRS